MVKAERAIETHSAIPTGNYIVVLSYPAGDAWNHRFCQAHYILHFSYAYIPKIKLDVYISHSKILTTIIK